LRGRIARPSAAALWTMSSTTSVGVLRTIAQQGTIILARGWHFAGIMLVFCWPASSAILKAYRHGDGAGGEAHCGHVPGHGGGPCFYRCLRLYAHKVSAR